MQTAVEIVDELNSAKVKLNVMATIDTLKYLKMGGRISALTAFAGEALGIKPVVAMIDGKIKMIDKARGLKRGSQLLMNIASAKEIDFSKPHGYVWSGHDMTNIKNFAEDNTLFEKDQPFYIIGSTIGAHIGAGAVGFAFFEK